MTGRRIDAAEAERIGLVGVVAASGELEATAAAVAGQIAGNGPIAVRAATAAIDQGSGLPIAEGLEVEARCYERVLGTSDRLEGLAAFAEKRKPVYRGE